MSQRLENVVRANRAKSNRFEKHPSLRPIKTFNDWFGIVSSAVANVGIVGAPLGLILGPLLLTAYAKRVSGLWGGAPILSSEAFSLPLFPLLSLAALGIIGFALLLVLFSALAGREGSRKSLVGYFPSLRLAEGGSKGPLGYREVVEASRDYLIVYLPAIVFMASLLLVPNITLVTSTSFFFGLCASHFYMLAAKGEEGLWRASATLAWWNFVYAGFLLAASLFFWRVFNLLYRGNGGESVLGLYVGILVFLYCDYFLFVRRVKMHVALSGLVLLAFCGAFFFPGPSVVGAVSLRALGIGGGLPASMLVKTYGTDPTKPSGTVVVRGCIALNLGGQVAIEEFRSAPSTCDLNHWTTTGRDDMLKKFCRISVYLRSDVVRISGVEARYEVGEAAPVAACDRSSAERLNPG